MLNAYNIKFITYFTVMAMVAMVAVFIVNNYLIFWHGWLGSANLLSYYGLWGEPYSKEISSINMLLGWLQLCSYILAISIPLYITKRNIAQNLSIYNQQMIDIAAFITRFGFWAVFLVGMVDLVISFLRIEGGLELLVGSELTKQLGRSQFRGSYVHIPLLFVALYCTHRYKKIDFIWLTTLVVLAEFQIVVTRFIFSYEQAFMGDLVRFWYAALFLFASAYTLIHEGHVRVDVFYANFTRQRQSLCNAIGTIFLGIPLCWVILIRGMWEKTYVINSSLLAFEVSQSGFGLYVKYLMAGFLLIFAVSMMVQFCGYLIKAVGELIGEIPYTEYQAQSH